MYISLHICTFPSPERYKYLENSLREAQRPGQAAAGRRQYTAEGGAGAAQGAGPIGAAAAGEEEEGVIIVPEEEPEDARPCPMCLDALNVRAHCF